jgi:uncharacterized membrane protein YgdD (TMEM256/DUF423 family)
MTRLFFTAGAWLAAVAVLLGAFAAHTLEDRVTPERLEVFETGARYHIYHALALLAVSWAWSQWPIWQVTWAGWLFIAGIAIFSGSLYMLVLTDTPWLGAVTPIGGLAFVGGWILLGWAALAGAN